MSHCTRRLAAMALCAAGVLFSAAPAVADEPELSGQWYGTGDSLTNPGLTGNLSIDIFEYAPGLHAGELTVHALGFFDTLVPVTVDGTTITIGDPNVLAFVGTRDGDTISGVSALPSPVPPFFDVFAWQFFKDTGEEPLPGEYPGPVCDELRTCSAREAPQTAAKLIPFEPVYGAGYMNYPLNGETWQNQYRSYIRRDLMMLIDYATAKVACMTEDWDYGNGAPVGLGDMSEADGSIPGTSVGFPGHPAGTHEDGKDADLAYYQRFAVNNKLRAIGVHWDENYVDQFHLVEPPNTLDLWRTALLLAYLAEHPRLRVVGVDGQAGLLLEDALDELVSRGWIDAQLRESIPLAYEVEDTGLYWFLHHHHHLHVSMLPVTDILDSVEIHPGTLNRKSRGKTVTAYLELAPGYDVRAIDVASVAVILDGHTVLPANAKPTRVGDHDRDGVPDLMVKFDRQALQGSLAPGQVELTVTGTIGGLFFQATDTVRVR